jgi:hypothetical protein
MKFILSSLLVFLCVFAKAQVPPPMVLGGPQGIDVTRLLARNWMSTPIYTDTPSSPLTGAGWPGRGYLITVVRNETACQNCPPKDTTLWMYTGARWKRVGYDYLTRLVYGGTVSKVSGQNLRYLIQPYGAFFDGDYKIGATSKTAVLSPKTIDNTSRVDVLVLNRDSFLVKTGIPSVIPKKPLITGSEVEVASFYFKAFDSIPTVINTSSKVTNIFRIPGIDSFYFNIDTLTFAIKDSVGITKNDTAFMLNNYKFTAANGLTKDSTVFRLGGSLNQNTNINLNTRRLSFIGGSDTTRFFSNGRVSIGGTPDSTGGYMLNVNEAVSVRNKIDFSPGPIRIGVRGFTAGGSATNASIVAIGLAAANSLQSAGGNSIVSIGVSSGSDLTTGGRYSVMIGRSAGRGITTGEDNIIIAAGDATNIPSNTSNAIHLVAGGGYETNKADTALLGLTSKYAFIGGGFSPTDYINDFYLGAGHRVVRPDLANLNLYAPSGFPTKVDTIGSNFTINAGRGTGTGVGGSIIFRTSDTTATGTTLQTLTERVRITPRGNMLVGTSADSLFRLDVNGRVRLRDTLTLSTTPVTADTSANDLLVINSSNGQVRRYTGNWYSVPLTGSATLDFPSTGHGNSADLTFTLTGADEGDVVALGIPNASIVANGSFIAWVSSTNTITVRFNNYASSGSSNPANGTFKIKVFK